jgi:BirA family transcriptional regulator, biotin operon repressor / biotin---[acetyl-CoA-carboxylase] ligase
MQSAMQSAGLVNRFEFFESVDSTNAELKRQLAAGETWPDFSAIAAASQSAGRGRLGRDWVSEPGTSLSVSLVLRPPNNELAGWLPLAGGLAVAAVVRGLLPGVEVGVKWPNDVLVAGKKISGVLAEAVTPGVVILGIGLNLKPQQQFSAASSLAEHGLKLSLDEALALVIAAFRGRYLRLGLTDGLAEAKAELRDNCVTLGQRVRAVLPDGSELLGIATDIDANGRLLLAHTDSAETTALSAAEVWHLRN